MRWCGLQSEKEIFVDEVDEEAVINENLGKRRESHSEKLLSDCFRLQLKNSTHRLCMMLQCL